MMRKCTCIILCISVIFGVLAASSLACIGCIYRHDIRDYLKSHGFWFACAERNYDLPVFQSIANISNDLYMYITASEHNYIHKSIPKRYFIAAAEKKDSNRGLFVEFIFFYQLKPCKKLVEKQSKDRGYEVKRYTEITFTEDGKISLSFDKSSISGWDVSYEGFNKQVSLILHLL
jgi:hypothetical protein